MHAPRERGAVAVEFALVVPLLVLFLLGIVEGGARYTQQSEVNHWAFLVARDLSIDPSKSAGTLLGDLNGGSTAGYSVSATPGALCSTPSASTVTVVISAERESPSGMFGSYTIKGEGVARCEN